MLKRIKSGLNKRKVKIFLLFLICSGLAWFISKLSDSYTSRTTFDLVYTNVPDSLLLTNASKKYVDVKLKASGFQFLWFNFKNKKVKIDVSAMEYRGSSYFVPQNVYTRQIDRQVGSMTLLDIDKDTLFFRFSEVYNRKVPVISSASIELVQNYLLQGGVLLQPDSITVRGPKNEIDTIKEVQTLKMVLPEIASDFSKNISLYKPAALKNTTFSENTVRISGKVFLFSEKEIKVPVTVVNLPEETQVKTFPSTVTILCKAQRDALKDLKASDFELIADYASVKDNGNNTMGLQLRKKPKTVFSTRLLEIEVEFILSRE